MGSLLEEARRILSGDDLLTAAQKQLSEDVVFETQDGGRVVRGDGGELSFTSPGYATSDPAIIDRIMQGENAGRASVSAFDQQTIARAPVAARLTEYVQGAPLVGEYVDEAVGLVSPNAKQGMRAMSNAMERENPVESMVLNVLGGVTGTVGALGTKTVGKVADSTVDFINKGRGIGKAVRAVGAGMLGGAVEGAVSMSGRGVSAQERGEGAMVGAGMGAAFGGALTAISPPLAMLTKEAVKIAKKVDVRAIANEFGISVPAAKIIKGYLQNEDFATAGQILARNDEAMLAESGEGTKQLLDTVMSSGGDALAIGRKNVNARLSASGERFQEKFSELFGPQSGGVIGRHIQIAKNTAPKRQAAYDLAYSQPTPMTGPGADAIDAALSKIHPDDLKSALKEAERAALSDGRQNLNLFARVGDDGAIELTQPFSIQELDYIIRGLSAVKRNGTDALGGVSDAARIAGDRARELSVALKSAVPEYRQAVQLGGDKIKTQEALILGRSLLDDKTTIEAVRNTLKGAPEDVRVAMADGLGEAINHHMGRARATLADLESGRIDFETFDNQFGESVQALRAISTPNNLKKVAAVMGSDVKKLTGELQRVADALILRGAVARGSQTAIRQFGQAAIRDVTQPGTVRRIAGNMGSPFDAAKEVTQRLAAIDPASISGLEQGYLSEVARVLTETKGEAAMRALNSVENLLKGQPLKEEEAALIGKMVGFSIQVGGQKAQQSTLSPAR